MNWKLFKGRSFWIKYCLKLDLLYSPRNGYLKLNQLHPCNCVMSPKQSKRYMYSLKGVFVNNNIPCFAKVHALLCAHLWISWKWEGTTGTGDGRMTPRRPPWWGQNADLEPRPEQELALTWVSTGDDSYRYWLKKKLQCPMSCLSIRAALSRNSNNDVCLLHLPEGHWRTIAKYMS